MLSNDLVQIDNQINIVFYGDNQILSLELTTTNDLTINNQLTKQSSISTFSFKELKSLTFIGNDFNYPNLFIISNCLSIITSNPLKINTTMTVSSNLSIVIPNNLAQSRIPIQLGSIFIDKGSIQMQSSFIDLQIQYLRFSSIFYPINPCVGLGGSATVVVEKVDYNGNFSKIRYDSLKIMLDITEPQTDESLSLLMSQDWEVITFKSYPNEFKEVEKFSNLTYSTNTIYGFVSSGNLINAKAIKSDKYIIRFNVMSYTDIPFLICYSISDNCPNFYNRIDNISIISEIIPSKQKNVTILMKDAEPIDLTGLKTINCDFKITKTSLYEINSIITNEYSENPNINHLWFDKFDFGEKEFILNANKITFTNCDYAHYKVNKMNLTINKECSVFADAYSTIIFQGLTQDLKSTLIDGYEVGDYKYGCATEIRFYPKRLEFRRGNQYKDIFISHSPNCDINLPIYIDEDFEISIVFPASLTLNRLSFHFISHKNNKIDPSVPRKKIILYNLTDNIKINTLEFDFGKFTNRSVFDLRNSQKKDFIKYVGNDVKFANLSLNPNYNFCACNEIVCNKCEDDMIKVNIDELSQKIENIFNDLIHITFITDTNENLPVLNLTPLNNNMVFIKGYDQNTAIKIDCSTEYIDDFNNISFQSIKLIPSNAKKCRITNLLLSKDCVVDPLFNDVSLIVNSMYCYSHHIEFKTIDVQKSLSLDGNLSESTSKTKISFSRYSTFKYEFKHSIIISGSILKCNDIEIDMNGIIPDFSYSSSIEEFNIFGENANINSLEKNIYFTLGSSNKIIRFDGTWTNESSTIFFYIYKKYKNQNILALRSQNVPIRNYLNIIQLEDEYVGITGFVQYCDMIQSTISTISHFYIKNLQNEGDVLFNSSKIELKIGNFFTGIIFHLNIDLYNHNYIEVEGEIQVPQSFECNVICSIDCELNDSRLFDFMREDHVLFRFLIPDYRLRYSPYVSFAPNCPFGFNNDNFGLKLSYHNDILYFHTYNNPLEGEIILRYVNNGDCKKSNCNFPVISDEDLNNSLDKFIPLNNANVTFILYTEFSKNLILNFDNENINIHKLTIFTNKYFKTSVPIKFGSSVTNLVAQNIDLDILEYDIKLQNLFLRNSTLPNEINYSNIKKIDVDDISLSKLNITEYENELEINVQSTNDFLFTQNGVRINNFEIDPDKFTNTGITINVSNPKMNLEENLTTVKHVKSWAINTSNIYFGYNWDKINSSQVIELNYLYLYSSLFVYPLSFPIKTWSFNTTIYTFEFEENIFPITETVILNKSIIISRKKNFNIVFNHIIINTTLSIQFSDKYSTYNDQINKLTIKEGASVSILKTKIMDEITLEPGANLLFGSFGENLSAINLEWDLNKEPYCHFSSSYRNFPITSSINIIYKGTSVEGREREFNSFFFVNSVNLLRWPGHKLNMKNVHFISENVKEFNDGPNLKLSLTDKHYNDNEIISLVLKERYPVSDTITPSLTVTMIPTSHLTPTPIEIPVEPLVNDSYVLAGSSIEFTEKGYKDDNKDVTINNINNDISLLKSSKNELILSTSETSKPKKDLFISPQSKNANINISPPSEGRVDYGEGEFGVHANSNNPNIILPQSDVPLNIFNNEESEITFKFKNEDNKEKISLEKLTVSKGNLVINVPKGTTKIEFNEIETFSDGKIGTFTKDDKENQLETAIGTLKLNSYSTLQVSSINLMNKLELNDKSKIEINANAKFNNQTEIILNKLSFIEFGTSTIEGICNEIKLVRSSRSNVELLSNEIKATLICGVKFDCTAWKDKFNSDDDAYNYPECNKKNDEMCLEVGKNIDVPNEKPDQSPKPDEDPKGSSDNGKNSLSKGAIAGIVVVVVVVVVAAAVCGFFIWKKKSSTKEKSEAEDNEKGDENDNNVSFL